MCRKIGDVGRWLVYEPCGGPFNMIRKLGEISQGAFADISTVKEDPLTDITALEHVGFVMKDGRVFKQKTGSSAGN